MELVEAMLYRATLRLVHVGKLVSHASDVGVRMQAGGLKLLTEDSAWPIVR